MGRATRVALAWIVALSFVLSSTFSLHAEHLSANPLVAGAHGWNAGHADDPGPAGEPEQSCHCWCQHFSAVSAPAPVLCLPVFAVSPGPPMVWAAPPIEPATPERPPRS